MKRAISIISILFVSNAFAEHLDNIQILDVMAGASSGSEDATWFRVSGLVGHESCQYAPGNVTLFYATNDGPVSADKALAILMSAKLANRRVSIEYVTTGVDSDFSGYGISSCQLHRVSIQ